MREGGVVGLETSGPVASVAVSLGREVLARRFLGEQGRHAATLLPALDEVLAEAGLEPADLRGVVVGTGPGSFTGVRVAAAAAKGIAHALDIPLYPVSSLTAAALAERVPAAAIREGPWPDPASHSGDVARTRDRVVLFDARGERLFSASFRLGDEEVEVLEPPAFRLLSEVMADRSRAHALHCGSGALRHADALRGDGRVVLAAPFGFPTADALLLRMSWDSPPPAVAAPFDWEPDYLRETGAVRSRSP
jgi:tRNA threonylcarbamoyladenosine biosynthesis protein TsaB